MRIHLGYPSVEDEVVIMNRQQHVHPVEELEQVSDAEEILDLQEAVKDVWVDPLVKQYAATLVEATRQHEAVFLGASPRGSLALYRTSQARALLEGRDYVLPDDLKALAYSVLGHRVIVSPAARLKGVTAEEVVAQCLESVPVPGVRARRTP
jgi:MoxR-like ATPase